MSGYSVKSSQYPDNITDVIYESGQWVPSWYEHLKSTGSEPSAECCKAVDDAIAYNSSPSGLLFSDSKQSTPDGCYLYYESWTGQKFYVLGAQ